MSSDQKTAMKIFGVFLAVGIVLPAIDALLSVALPPPEWIENNRHHAMFSLIHMYYAPVIWLFRPLLLALQNANAGAVVLAFLGLFLGLFFVLIVNAGIYTAISLGLMKLMHLIRSHYVE